MNEVRHIPSVVTDEAAERTIRQLTRRSFTTGALAALAGGGSVAWLASRSSDGGIPGPLRRVLEFNQRIAQASFSQDQLAPEFSADRASEPRVNGRYGLNQPVDLASWRLEVRGYRARSLPLEAIKQLPEQTMITEFKCVEGWSRVVQWTGVRLADFAAKHHQSGKYVSLETPGSGYFVGLDIAAALHPQTLLCYAMNGHPLAPEHGAPLRLVSTVKYGLKNIKCIGSIQFTNEQPKDYWALRGYDWYAGL
jgi:DMSO/TMAO reductase YedYZ molybdopterin-dependent catalytic subunit